MMTPFLTTVRHTCCGWTLRIPTESVGFNVVGHRKVCPLWGRRG